MASKDPSMPLYVNDWLSSMRVQTMSPAQELAYFRLCLFCWASQEAALPDDDEQLMAMARWPRSKGGSRVVENGWALVRGCFQPHPNKPGFLTNERVLELWEERQRWREKSRMGGKKSAEKRCGKRGYEELKGGSTTVPTKRQPSANSSSSSSSSIRKPLSPLPPANWLPPQELNTDRFREAWSRWESHRREIKEPLTPQTREMQLVQLAKIGEDEAIALINNTIANGWQGLRDSRGSLNEIVKKTSLGGTVSEYPLLVGVDGKRIGKETA